MNNTQIITPVNLDTEQAVERHLEEGTIAVRQRNPGGATGTPRSRLKAVANGATQLRVGDVESLLVDHALDADQRAKGLGHTASELVAFLLSEEKPDPEATLKVVRDLSSLAFKNAGEMRKSLELATRIQRRPPPRVQILGVSGQVNVGDKQINTRSLEVGD